MDDKGNIFTIHIVSYFEGSWFKERNANIHGSFTRQATLEFDEFDFEAKKYSFMGFVVIPVEKKSRKQKKPPKNDQNSNKRPKN